MTTMLNVLRFRDPADYSATPALAPLTPITGEAALVYTSCARYLTW